MIIVVNGNVINTENIYVITPITKTQEYLDDIFAYVFGITMFNNVSIEVFSHQKITREDLVTFRQSLIDIWTANQSTLPQFNI